MNLLGFALEAALAGIGALLAAFAAYLLALALAAAVARVLRPRPRPAVRHAGRVAVVVPAHDEALLIADTVAALRAQTFARERFEVVVVADNCSDDTAAIAARAGARVLERTDPERRGKGYALRHAMQALLAEPQPPDAIAVVDADTRPDPDFLERVVAAYEAGADAAQGSSLVVPDEAVRSRLREISYLLINQARPTGRRLLGLATPLQGNGMLFARALLEAHPWNAFTSAEDLEYGVRLQLAGRRVEYAPGAYVRSPTAPTQEAADLQSERWEGGKLHVARTLVPDLVREGLRRRKLALLETATGILLPPLGLLAAFAAAGTLVAAALAAPGLVTWWAVAPYVAALLALAASVLTGMWAVRAPARAYRALAGGPMLAARKLARVRRTFAHSEESWVRTARAQ
jgi:cellulose synthase/poly-beta-1,6-N-acetylglucosamine synthase-like glycosyltransferase